MHGAMRLLDRHVRVGAHAGVGVRDGDALLAVVIAAAVPGYRFLILVVTLYTT